MRLRPRMRVRLPPGRERREQTGIVYCLSRDDSEVVAAQIREHADVPAAHYHAGMTPAQRMRVQNDWRAGRTQVGGRWAAGWRATGGRQIGQ